jgi:hypothetical protein
MTTATDTTNNAIAQTATDTTNAAMKTWQAA